MELHTQAIDRSVLEAIRSLQLPDADDLVGQIIETYIGESADLMSALGDAVRELDSERVRACSHTLKSSSGNVGARRVVDLARQLEMAARDAKDGDFESLFVELQIERARAVQELDLMMMAA